MSKDLLAQSLLVEGIDYLFFFIWERLMNQGSEWASLGKVMFHIYFMQWWLPYCKVSDTHFHKSLIEFCTLFKESWLKTAVIFL